jgi:hypothetical protein
MQYYPIKIANLRKTWSLASFKMKHREESRRLLAFAYNQEKITQHLPGRARHRIAAYSAPSLIARWTA